MVAELLRDFVQEPWVADLELDQMERSNARYHTDDDQRREGDVVWRIPLRAGGDAYLLLMLEFQSSPDRWMALRAMVYTGLLWQHILLIAGFSDRSNLAASCRNGGFPCRIWAPTVRRDKINRWNCLERNFVGVRVGCSQSAMSVLTQNVRGPIQPITEKVGHFSASCPNSRGQRNPQ
jgi:hypothetical protein